MRILINGFNMGSGGGLAHAHAILTGLSRLEGGHDFLAIVPDLPEYRALDGVGRLRLRLHPVRWAFPLRHVQYYVREIGRAARAFNAEAVLSLTSLAVPRIDLPQFVLANQALLAVPATYYRPGAPIWFRIKVALQRLTFRAGLQRTSALIVHSRFMEQHFRATWSFGGAIVHVPAFKDVSAPVTKMPAPIQQLLTADPHFKVLYPASYSHYKNFKPLLDAFVLLRHRRRPIRLVTTIPKVKASEPFFKAISELGLEDTVINIGSLPHAAMPALYQLVDATVQVSLLESYGLTYIESFQHERPQVVSDLPFAREMCGEACLYAPSSSAEGIADAIERLEQDPSLRAELVRRGRERLATAVVSVEEYARRLVNAVVQGTSRATGVSGSGVAPRLRTTI